MIRFERPEQGGVVYLSEGQAAIDPNELKKTYNEGGDEVGTVTFVSGVPLPVSVMPELGSSNRALTDFGFLEVSSPEAGIDGQSTPGASFTEKALDLIKDLTTNEYAEWVGNLTGEICSNITEVAGILGNPEITSLSPEEAQRYDATTALYRASVTTVTEGIAGEAIGTIVDKSVDAVEYIGENASIRLCKNVDPDVVKGDYRDGLELVKSAIDTSSDVLKAWGLFTNNKK